MLRQAMNEFKLNLAANQLQNISFHLQMYRLSDMPLTRILTKAVQFKYKA